jgi:ubiquinone/menaquinone biosynthesis C-methylase UbiE
MKRPKARELTMPTMSNIESAFCRSAPWRALTRRIVIPWALQQSAPAGHVLEIGAGSGAMAAELLIEYPDIRMTVTDFDATMVDAARERLARFGDRAVVRQADASALPFEPETVDTVVSFIMLHHTVAWEKVLAETARVLRPGGRLVGYDLLSTAPARLLHRLEGQPFLRIATMPQLQHTMSALPFEHVVLHKRLAGLAVQFRAQRSVPDTSRRTSDRVTYEVR